MKQSKTIITTALVLTGLLAASQTQAAAVTFNFSSSNAWTKSDLVFNSGTDSVTVGAFNGGNDTSVSSTRVFVGANSAGLVACSGGNSNTGGSATGCSGDEHTISSNGADEDIKFTFSQEVTLLSATFKYWDGKGSSASDMDDFSLFVGTTPRFTDQTIITGSNDGTATFNFATVGGDLTDSVFYIGARGDGDTFKLYSLTVEIPAVPEPSTYLLMLSGLGLLGWKFGRKSLQA
ncbi:PEP-CTERM sorting domain-containing protein [Nitrosomonas sp. sh817]|uniref:PEP-CTERM sorting domain-containing protein n=1 Tax=Nitrosomonas sp. sh817 TaxID=3070658 RepID=UPI0027DCBE80|nr:PEP-CTERM sorting domain-containing protein [Nitrosomonas sp. sh817]WMJ08457.1 PEP-CTERM sorting domain-containing protein [Nitrosomonas sp. sh817]